MGKTLAWYGAAAGMAMAVMSCDGSKSGDVLTGDGDGDGDTDTGGTSGDGDGDSDTGGTAGDGDGGGHTGGAPGDGDGDNAGGGAGEAGGAAGSPSQVDCEGLSERKCTEEVDCGPLYGTTLDTLGESNYAGCRWFGSGGNYTACNSAVSCHVSPATGVCWVFGNDCGPDGWEPVSEDPADAAFLETCPEPCSSFWGE